MAAFLLLPTDAALTLADIETWVARARALGASDDSPVTVGEPPLASDRDGTVTLSVPVTVSRTILPGRTRSTAPAVTDDERDEAGADDSSGA